MSDRTTNLLGALGLAVADRMEDATRHILNRGGQTPAALVVIGHGTSPSNEQLRAILGLSHPGAVRLVDRLVADGLVERGKARDRRAVALCLTERGQAVRDELLEGRFAAIRPLLAPLTDIEKDQLEGLLGKMLMATNPSDAERRRLCRLCHTSVCTECPIPADFAIDDEGPDVLRSG